MKIQFFKTSQQLCRNPKFLTMDGPLPDFNMKKKNSNLVGIYLVFQRSKKTKTKLISTAFKKDDL